MKLHLKGLLALFVTITGCSSNNNATTPIGGEWISQTCEIIATATGLGTVTNTWGKGTFNFTPEGELLIGFKSYADSDCLTQSSEVIGTIANTQISYKHLGPASIQEGIEAFGLSLQPYRNGSDTEFSAFYTINNNSLCLSETFSFGNGGGISLSGDQNKLAIDFNRCLINP